MICVCCGLIWMVLMDVGKSNGDRIIPEEVSISSSVKSSEKNASTPSTCKRRSVSDISSPIRDRRRSPSPVASRASSKHGHPPQRRLPFETSSRSSASLSPKKHSMVSSSSRPSTPVCDSLSETNVSSQRSVSRRSIDGLWPSTRSLSSSFNLGSASEQTSKKERDNKAESALNPSVDGLSNKKRVPLKGKNASDQLENSKPVKKLKPRGIDQCRRPRSLHSSPMSKSLDLTDKPRRSCSLPLSSKAVSPPRRSLSSIGTTTNAKSSNSPDHSKKATLLAPSRNTKLLSSGSAQRPSSPSKILSPQASSSKSSVSPSRPRSSTGGQMGKMAKNALGRADSGVVSDLSVSSDSAIIINALSKSSRKLVPLPSSAKLHSLLRSKTSMTLVSSSRSTAKSLQGRPSTGDGPRKMPLSGIRRNLGPVPSLSASLDSLESGIRMSRSNSTSSLLIPGLLPSPSPCKTTSSKSAASVSRPGVRAAMPPSNGISYSTTGCISDLWKRNKNSNGKEGAHNLKLLYNRYLQWHFVNARMEAALSVRKTKAENAFYDMWVAISDLIDSIVNKKIKLQQMKQEMQLHLILKQQMAYLEAWNLQEDEHCSSLSGAIRKLKASTIILPVTGRARAGLHSMKDAISSAIDILQGTASSICYLLSRVEGISNSASGLSMMAEKERTMLEECEKLLASAVALQVQESSLVTHLLQLRKDMLHSAPLAH